ncbi:hypothetical protein [Mesorhizobium sp. B2-6-2]|uniref:hypothetical protein n=1 Tax=Mesorhizobium sp. B2-6-2 TaxID=2589915 RepID=UPI001FED3DEC|nr:hypothetical protein [Mesorhizobium sp. B2-6-2]
MRIDANGVAPSPSCLLAEMPPRPKAQGNTVLPACRKPCAGLPGRARTTKTLKPFGKNAPDALRERFFLYDWVTEQITVIGCCAGELPHKWGEVN